MHWPGLAGWKRAIKKIRGYPAYSNLQFDNYLLQITRDEKTVEQGRKIIEENWDRIQWVDAFTESGILPNTGFFSEMSRRIRHKILPVVLEHDNILYFIQELFYKRFDYEWVNAIPNEKWENLLEPFDITSRLVSPYFQSQVENAIIILSQRIAVLALEKEISQRLPEIDKLYSPFINQGQLVTAFIRYNGDVDKEQIFEEWNRCLKWLEDIRTRRAEYGASLHLTFLLLRLEQQIKRAILLLKIFRPEHETALPEFIRFLKLVVQDQNLKNSIREHFTQNLGLLAYQVAEHTGKTGEHYITRTPAEYFHFFRASAQGGAIVGFLALFKTLIYYLRLAPFGQALGYSLNYAFGFIFIHVSHSALATKQPAMTASHIAGSLEEGENSKNTSLPGLAIMIARVMRSQFISFVGNLLVCFPMGAALAILWVLIFGEHLVDAEKAHHMVLDIHPWLSGSLFYGAIAGVCLFVSGLISGYFDNLVVYSKIPLRIAEHPVIKYSLKPEWGQKLAAYIDENLGSLAGNFFLGVFLGSMSTIGFIFGIGIDIRHITFSTANFGIAVVGLNGALEWSEIIWSVVGILGIGFMNFFVSFGLAFFVAIRSKKISFKQTRSFFTILQSYFLKHPLDFVIPPKRERTPEEIMHRE